MDIKHFVGKQIREARKEKGLTQIDFAALIKSKQSTISDIELGNIGITAEQLAHFATLLDKPITYFFPAHIDKKLAALEAELVNIFRSLSPFFQQRLLAEAKLQAKLYQQLQPYIRADIPDDLFAMMVYEREEMLKSYEDEEDLRAYEALSVEEREQENKRNRQEYFAAQKRLEEFKKRVDAELAKMGDAET